jgi:uncharacterized metal-binding protein
MTAAAHTSRETLQGGPDTSTDHPLVFACAGCSFAGRLAYDLAHDLDQRRVAQMSCLAGLAADLPYFRRQVHGRRLWIIDGCPLECARGVFRRTGHAVDGHIRLHDLGINKKSPPEERIDVDLLVTRAMNAMHIAQSPSPEQKGHSNDANTTQS